MMIQGAAIISVTVIGKEGPGAERSLCILA
jgi:hypothetical protein